MERCANHNKRPESRETPGDEMKKERKKGIRKEDEFDQIFITMSRFGEEDYIVHCMQTEHPQEPDLDDGRAPGDQSQ